jgi:dTDP-4-amino-4,6-dideoxygalactose transaminase
MDLQAALGLHQLRRLDGFIEERRRRAGVYDAAFRQMPGFLLPKPVPYPARHAWHLYTPFVDLDHLSIDRDRFINELKARNIGAGLHYTAVHEFSYYVRRFGWRPDDYPEAHWVSERILSLPLFPGMTDRDQSDVIEAVVDIVRRHGR